MNVKLILVVFFALCYLLTTTLTSQISQPDKPLVVATASIFADMAAAIGDTLIETTMIVPVGGDPHIYEPTPGDVRMLFKADLILQNGLTFEGWITDLIRNSGASAPVITLTEGIQPITSPEHNNASDPHAWMDPLFGKIYARNIYTALKELLPAHHEALDRQYDQYIQELDSLDAYIRREVAQIDSSRRIVITSHDAFTYYGQRYGLRLESLQGTSTDAEVRTSDLMRVNQVIQEYNIPVVFVESTINPKMLEQIAKDQQIRIGGKLYSDSLGEEDSPASTYLGMIRSNTDVIVAGLTSTPTTQPPATGSKTWRWFLLIGGAIVLIWILAVLRRKFLA